MSEQAKTDLSDALRAHVEAPLRVRLEASNVAYNRAIKRAKWAEASACAAQSKNVEYAKRVARLTRERDDAQAGFGAELNMLRERVPNLERALQVEKETHAMCRRTIEVLEGRLRGAEDHEKREQISQGLLETERKAKEGLAANVHAQAARINGLEAVNDQQAARIKELEAALQTLAKAHEDRTHERDEARRDAQRAPTHEELAGAYKRGCAAQMQACADELMAVRKELVGFPVVTKGHTWDVALMKIRSLGRTMGEKRARKAEEATDARWTSYIANQIHTHGFPGGKSVDTFDVKRDLQRALQLGRDARDAAKRPAPAPPQEALPLAQLRQLITDAVRETYGHVSPVAPKQFPTRIGSREFVKMCEAWHGSGIHQYSYMQATHAYRRSVEDRLSAALKAIGIEVVS